LKFFIVGAGKIADVVCYEAGLIDDANLLSFAVEPEHISADTKFDRPVLDLSTAISLYPPTGYGCFVALGYHALNSARARLVADLVSRGYSLLSFYDRESVDGAGVSVGYNCFVMRTAAVQPQVSLGNGVFVFGGANIGHHSVVHDFCWVASGASVGGNSTIGERTFLGLNSTIGHGVTVGARTIVGASAVVVRNCERESAYIQSGTTPYRLNSTEVSGMYSL